MYGNGKIFVSHTHEDNAVCEPLLAALDAWQADYWFDAAQLSAGLEFFDYIQRALGERDIFLRICTPAAVASHWMTEEQKLARALRAPNRSQQRLIINLILKPGYVASAEEAKDLVIDATQGSQVEWLRRLREALDIPSRERHISRRTVLGLGITSVAALGGIAFAGNLYLNRSSPIVFKPTAHEPTPTALPGASRIRWTYALTVVGFDDPTGIAVAGDALICTMLGSIMALNSSDGALRWEMSYNIINMNVPPTVVGDTVYFATLELTVSPTDASVYFNDTYLYALNIADGSERWRQLVFSDSRTGLTAEYYTSAITVAGNTACIRYNETLYAFDATTGKALWHQTAGKPPTGVGVVLPAPTIVDGTVYATLGDDKLHAFSATDGAPIWQTPFIGDLPTDVTADARKKLPLHPPIHVQPIAADGLIYVGADTGFCYALDAKTGQVRWQSQLLKQPDATFLLSYLTLSDGVLYAGGGFPLTDDVFSGALHGGSVQAIDAKTGKILWPSVPADQITLGDMQSDYIRTRPLVAGSDIFVAIRLEATNSKNVNVLFSLDKATGKVRWSFEMWGAKQIGSAGAFPSDPVISHDTLYIVSGNHTLYALSYAD